LKMSTTNAFSLLDTDANDSKVVAKKKEAPAKKVAKKPAPAPAPAPAKKTTKAPEKEVRGSKIPDSAVEQKRGGGKAPAGRKLAIQRNGNRPPKREFDRHDGTGRAHEGPKKRGAGRGNWGKVTEHGAEEKPEQQEKPEPEMTEEEKAAKELRDKQQTLDQYRKEQKGVKTILHTAAPVEVECSVDEKNFAPIARVDLVAEQEKLIASEKGAKKAPEPAKKAEKAPKKAKKEDAKIEIQFSDNRREHHARESSKPVKLGEKDFPSL